MFNIKITLLTVILLVSTLTVFGQSKPNNIAKFTDYNAAEFDSLATARSEFRASMFAGKIEVSDASWKWSSTNPSGWNTASFNDAGLSSAVEQASYGDAPWSKWATFPATTKAKWIWSSNTIGTSTNTTIYFRKTFTPNVSSADLQITVDETFTAYLNGVQIAKSGAGGWTSVQTAKLKLNPGVQNVIAVKATNSSGQAGLMAHIEFATFVPPPPPDPAIENAFWNVVRAGDTLADYNLYLTKYPKGTYAAIADLRITQINRKNPPTPTPIPTPSATPVPTPIPPTVTSTPINPAIENAYWKTVQAGDTLADYNTYLTKYPKGTYAAIANLRITQINRKNPTKPIPPKPAVITPDVVFLNKWAVQVKKLLPLPIGDVLLNDAVPNCKFGCPSNKGASFRPYLSISATTPKLAVPRVTKAQIEPTLRSTLVARYCSDGANKQNVAVEVSMVDMNKNFIGNFFINPSDCNVAVVPNPSPTPTNVGGTKTIEDLYWDRIKNSKDPKDFSSYLRAFPGGKYTPIARLEETRLGGGGVIASPMPITDENEWSSIKNSNDIKDYERYLNVFPNGKHKRDALLMIGKLKQEEATSDFLKNARFGGISEIAGKRRVFITATDFNSRSRIVTELRKKTSSLIFVNNATRADFFIEYKLTVSSACDPGTSTATNACELHTGQMWVHTKGLVGTVNEFNRILWTTTKSKSYGDSGVNFFDKNPAAQAGNDLAKELQRMGF